MGLDPHRHPQNQNSEKVDGMINVKELIDSLFHTGFIYDLADYWIRGLDEARERKAVDWRKHTCGECGYFHQYQGTGITSCRKNNLHNYKVCSDDPACPDCVLREVPK